MMAAGDIPMDDPIAFFLTWTTYGSWLPGDERGWVAKPGRFGEGDVVRRAVAGAKMTESALTLDGTQRNLVEQTVREHCEHRGWYLHVVNCRTQHVHTVVTAAEWNPERVLVELKAWATRRLKEAQHRTIGEKARQKWWTQGGSARQIFGEDALERVILYVRDGQSKKDGPADGCEN